jgi:hypothetical protein
VYEVEQGRAEIFQYTEKTGAEVHRRHVTDHHLRLKGQPSPGFVCLNKFCTKSRLLIPVASDVYSPLPGPPGHRHQPFKAGGAKTGDIRRRPGQ